MASTKSGTLPKPFPWKGTHIRVLRNEHVDGYWVPGYASTCHSVPGSGDEAAQLAPPDSMSSKNFTTLPDAVIFTSSTVQPVYTSFESARDTSRSEPNRNRSWIGWGRVAHELGIANEAFTQLAPRSPVKAPRVSQREDAWPSWISTQAQSYPSSHCSRCLNVRVFPVDPARLIGATVFSC